jgi:hypothetical protein
MAGTDPFAPQAYHKPVEAQDQVPYVLYHTLTIPAAASDSF